MLIHGDFKPFFANQACAVLFGYPDPAAIVALDSVLPLFAPTEHARLLEGERHRPHKEPVLAHDMVQGVRLDGKAIWVERVVTAVEWHGVPASQMVLVDVTAQKHAEDMQVLLAQEQGVSEGRYRLLVERSPDLILVHCDEGIVFLNRAGAAMLGAPAPESLLGTPMLPLIHPAYHGVASSRMQQVGDGSDLALVEEQFVRCDGQIIDVEVMRMGTTYMGRPAIQVVARDITLRKRLEIQLRQAQKMEAIGTLAGGIAHDFNNILTAILGYTELALEESAADSPVAASLHEIFTAGQRAKHLVQQILTFSRHREVTRRPVLLHRLIQETLGLLRATLPATITIRQYCVTTSDLVLADETQIQQVLINLCANAEYAMRTTGGELEVRLEAVDVTARLAAAHPPLKPGPHVCIGIRDTGHGIPADAIERIFDPFFTTKGVGEGTGMGLAIVHGIVRAHDGAVLVKSAIGCGTTVMVYLPRVSEASPVPDASASAPLQHGQECILLVDDEAPLAHLAQELLTRLGYQVVIRTSSVEALEVFRAAPERFDLVMTDQTMPVMPGDMLVQEIRALRPEIPVILCTGFSHTMTEEKARALGIDAFLMKPFTARELASAIRQGLERPSQHRA